jgi:hypothetical protein
MNKRLFTSSPQRWIFAFILLACLTSVLTSGQSDKAAQPRLPGGDYTVACRAFMGAGYESLPVLVTQVTSITGGGVAVRNFSVENNTTQAVEAVRVRWYLSRAETPETILSQGETSVVRIPGGIQPGTAARIKYPVTSFAAAIRPVVKSARLNGNYMIQLAVSEARFADGSTQTLVAADGKVSRASFAKVAYRPRPSAQTFCPGQHCTQVLAGGVPIGYKCADATNESCTNGGDGQTCSSGICGRPAGGGEIGGEEGGS